MSCLRATLKHQFQLRFVIYVDDFEYYGTSLCLFNDFKILLSKRYGDMIFNHPSKGLCGQALYAQANCASADSRAGRKSKKKRALP